jgi:hypothetical protein
VPEGEESEQEEQEQEKEERNGIPSRHYDQEYELVNLRIFCELALSKI